MKKLLLLMAVLLAGVLVGLSLPAKWRAKLSRPLVARFGPGMEHVPDD